MVVTVAFQGEPGAYSEQAALELLGNDVLTNGLDTFEKCFQAVENGTCTYALLPIENSLGGTIHANYDLQLRYGFFIVAEHDFRVRHCLMTKKGVEISEVTKVLSHPQALAQCDKYLRNRNLIGVNSYDTAGSAKKIAECQDDSLDNAAAIASSLAAKHYDMEIFESGIEDEENNYTRFLLLSKQWLPLPNIKKNKIDGSNPFKTTLVFSLTNYPGVLVKALSAFAHRDVSLTKLESRPDKLRLKGKENLIVWGDDKVQKIPDSDRNLLDRLRRNIVESDMMDQIDNIDQDINIGKSQNEEKKVSVCILR